MLSWNEIVQNYIIKHSKIIKKTTKPLQDHFGIGYFTYHRIDNEGKYIVLLDRPEWAEYYVSEQIYLNDPYLRHPSVYQSGISLIESNGSDEYKEEVLKAAKKILNMDMGTLFIHKTDYYAEFFGFSGNKKNCALESLYLNQQKILQSFAIHFKKELYSILTQMEREAGYLIDLKGDDFVNCQPINPFIASPATLIAFYKDLGLGEMIEKAAKLLLRERECLKWLLEEKSAKETAAILKLSSRTIEFYFENIKNKLCCWNKQELLKRARQLKEFGIL